MSTNILEMFKNRMPSMSQLITYQPEWLANGYCCQPSIQGGWQAVACHRHTSSCSTPRA